MLAANKNYSFPNAKSLAMAAAMPIVAVPIQEVQLLDYVVAHETVNSTYGLTANVDEDIYLGLMDKDPYTSDQQRERDQYELDDENWNEVVFEEVYGGSIAKLALHNDWINQKGYQVDAVVEMNLPEQGISGPFKITSIKNILPQKKPADEDTSDDYDYRPVTAIFTHVSDQVYNIDFDNGENLGVTFQHPIYSVTARDWQLEGELEIGEEVLTKSGTATVVCSERKKGSEVVYNLEVKELHNFLVGESGCWSSVIQKYGKGSKAVYETAIQHVWKGHNPLSKVQGKSYFKASLDDQIKLKQYVTEAQTKGEIISETIIERTVDGVRRTYTEIVKDMGENVGKLRDHETDTNILTIIFDITGKNPYINNTFPGLPSS